MRENRVRCALTGLGAMGKKYALWLDQGEIEAMDLTAVLCHSDETASWAKEHLRAKVVRSEEEMYENGDLFDAVIIATPHRLHPPIAIKAMQEGKHVMCDKPAGILMDDAARMDELAKEKYLVLGSMCHQRTYESHIRIKRLLDEKAIGDVTRVFMENTMFFRTRRYHESSSWRSSWSKEGGGALINQGYHLIDFWQDLFGLPESIYACIPFGKGNDFKVDDEVTMLMEYPGKMTGTLILSTIEGCGKNVLEIIGTKGRIILDDQLQVTTFNQDVKDYIQHANVASRQDLKETNVSYPVVEQTKPYHIMLENFRDAILHGIELIAPARDGVSALSMINAAYLSAWQEKKIKLPIDMEEYKFLLKQKEESEVVNYVGNKM